mmetsp:Transcript_57441/g.136550  ORF Transcript_57441/g.136550 Transcript_57441/m.136550 type:complete len:1127 (-) Transcript_57441:69-3449(-)
MASMMGMMHKAVVVGDPYETISPVTVRSECSLESEIVHPELPMGVPIEVLEVSSAMPRRIKIQAGKLVGWISYKTVQDEPLIKKRRKEDAAALSSIQPGPEQAEVKSMVTVRRGEDLTSDILKELKPGSLVEILEKGQLNQRRAKIKMVDTGEEGWISVQTRQGEALVGPVSLDIKSKTQGGLFNKLSTSKVKDLLEASRAGDVTTVQKISSGSSGIMSKFQTRPSMNCTDVRGQSPLIYAAAFGHTSVVKLLLSMDETDVNLVDNTFKSALHHACKRQHSPSANEDQAEIVRMLVSNNASLEGREHNGIVPLMFAAARGQLEMTRVLLDSNANPNVRDYEGHMPLDYANNFSQDEVAKFLRKQGARSEKDDEEDEKITIVGRSAEDFVLQHLATSERLGAEESNTLAAENVAGVAGTEKKKKTIRKKVPKVDGDGEVVSKPKLRKKKTSLKGEQQVQAARRASISAQLNADAFNNIVVGEEAADPKEAAAAKLKAVTEATSSSKELLEAIQEAETAGLAAGDLAAARQKLEELKGRGQLTEELIMASDHADIPKLRELIPKAEAGAVPAAEVAKAKKVLAEEGPKYEVRQKLTKAKEKADAALLEKALQEAKQAGLRSDELAEYEAFVKAAQSKELALENVKKAIASKNVEDLKASIAMAKEIGLSAPEVAEAEKVLAVEEPRQKARQMLKEAIEDPSLEKLEAVLKLCKEAGLPEAETKEAEEALANERRKGKALEEVKKVMEESKTVDRESIDALRECKEKFTAAIDEARSVGVSEALIATAEQERRKIHNKIEDLKGSIRVFCRVRPLSSKETNQGDTQVTKAVDGMTLAVNDQNFMFDAVFTPGTQDDVFNDCKDLVQSAVDGYNVTMFAYGQTGAGKTFTMYGTKDMPGTTPKTITELFRIIDRDAGNCTFTVMGSMMELYRNDLVDLLTKSEEEGKPSKKLNVRVDKNTVTVENLTEEECHTEADLTALLERGNAQRTVAATAMNSESSRSHLIVCIKIVSVNKETNAQTKGKILMCDLAGSERLKKSEVTGDQQKEAIEINKSLTALGDVIEQLTKNSKNIPYRNHKLTQVMQDALGGNAKTLMFVNCSPAASNEDETVMSLKWATRAKKITNKAQKG